MVEAVGEKAPWINANRITAAGAAGVLIADYLFVKHPKLKKTATALHVGSSVADAFDGEWERWQVEEKGKEPSQNGPLYDVLADKSQEVATFTAQAIKAKKDGKNLASAAYLLAAATSPLPALFRARAESGGHIVKEGGLGTRPVRAAIGAVGIAFGDRSSVPLLLGAGAAAQNIYTASQRYHAAEPGSPHCIGRLEDAQAVESSQQRYNALQLASAGAVAVTAAAARQIK
jgi:phosphatidylglycerophosphate synthase